MEEGMGSGAEGGSRLGRASRKSSQQTPVGKFHMVGGGMEENQKELLSLWMRSARPAMEQVGNQMYPSEAEVSRGQLVRNLECGQR